jgi:signal transduction histidine kinase
MTIKRLAFLGFVGWIFFAAERLPGAEASNILEIRSVLANGKAVAYEPGRELNLGAFPRNVTFVFGVASNATRVPMRVRCKLDGAENKWREGAGEMFVMVRFYNEAGDRVGQKAFRVRGDSTGWNSNVEGSTLTHRHETLTVPAGASRVWVIISSAGPPSTTGIYVVEGLTVTRALNNGGKSEILLQSPFDQRGEVSAENQTPAGWERDGTHPSMAKIVEIGHSHKTKAFAIVDDDPFGHAEWHNAKAFAPQVAPNDQLVVEWNEMFSIGENGCPPAVYESLAPGLYRFRVAEATIFGNNLTEMTLAVRVPVAIWEQPWSWAIAAALLVSVSALSARYVGRQRLQWAMSKLQHERALEQERLRIAQDIHDDLGARVTQISLVSGMARKDSTLSDKARADFERISLMSQELVAALYETVWAVNPQNDNLDAMGTYLCQRINELCAEAGLRCRLNVSSLPRDVEISSRARHNVIMAAKEAVHNVVKHAKASQVTIQLALENSSLTVSIHDDGLGFQADRPSSGGYGLANMKRRLEEIGGSCSIESRPGAGTTVHLRLPVRPSNDDSHAAALQRRPTWRK